MNWYLDKMKKVFYLQIKPESLKGFLVRSDNLLWVRVSSIAGNGNTYLILFLLSLNMWHYSFVIFISQFHEIEMFSIKMHPCIYFSQCGLQKKHWYLKIYNLQKTNFLIVLGEYPLNCHINLQHRPDFFIRHMHLNKHTHILIHTLD